MLPTGLWRRMLHRSGAVSNPATVGIISQATNPRLIQ
jgi:hypothetical protein